MIPATHVDLLIPTHRFKNAEPVRNTPTNFPPNLHPPPQLRQTARTVRYGTQSDLTYIYHLENELHDSIGFAPRGGLLDRLDTGRILIIEENGAHAGFINFTHRIDRITHISQLAVDPQLWRTLAGTLIMKTIINAAISAGSRFLTLKSAVNLPANRFWPTLGFKQQPSIPGKRRQLLPWVLQLDPTFPLHLIRPPKSQPRTIP